MAKPQRSTNLFRFLTLLAGPIAYLLASRFGPGQLGADQREVLGTGAWMVLWWLTEPVPLAVTSLLPIVILPLFGAMSVRDVTSPYASELIFLFLAGFLLAAALERWNAHQRLALRIVSLAGSNGRAVVLAVMAATAFLSMWISNTATAAMMYPIAVAVGMLFGEGRDADRLRTALLLGLAYAASIGGMGSLLGTPPNLIFAASAERFLGRPIDFVQFLSIGLPSMLILLPLCWALLVHVLFRGDVTLDDAARRHLRERRERLGPLRGAELATMLVFAAAALAWFFREPKDLGGTRLPGLATLTPGITDAAIGLAAALLLFVLPGTDERGARRPLLTWSEARAIPWDVLLLFGGGLSLAAALETTGLTTWVGRQLAEASALPSVTVILVFAVVTVALSELASNTAVAAMMLPIAAGIAPAVGLPPLALMAVAALSASAGFALPIATPPNALVYGSGRVTSRQMLMAGLVLDVIAIAVIVGVVSVVL